MSSARSARASKHKDLCFSSLQQRELTVSSSVQVANMVHFEDDTGQLAQWDEQIMGVCDTVNEVVDHIFTIQAA